MTTYKGTSGDDSSETGTQSKLFGYDGNDLLYTQLVHGHVVIYGGAGNDGLGYDGLGTADIYGGSGDDNLQGRWKGVDHLFGGGGNDWLLGGQSSDLLTGGSGDDQFEIFVRQKPDTITDFKPGRDQIELLDAHGQTLAYGHKVTYDEETGNLFYKYHGSNHLVATLPTGLHLTSDDFI